MRHTILDWRGSAARRDEGMERAVKHADIQWLADAEEAVLQTARRLSKFTTDDVWASGLPKPLSPRALGPVMASLSKRGIIQKTGEYRLTEQVLRHRAPIAVWRLV